MRIVELTAHIVRLPLRREVKHASATRRGSENVMIRCRLADGTEGWGEGVPRRYVTGETAEGALKQLNETHLGEQLLEDCDGWPDVIGLCERFNPAHSLEDTRGCYGNALRCAVELSVLDAFGKLFEQPVSAVAGEFEAARSVLRPRGEVQYSTAITAEGRRQETISSIKMRLYGFRQCKVKVGVAGADDVARLRGIRQWIGRRMDLRLDANEAWRAEDAVKRIEPLLKYNVSCVEQPLPHAEIEAQAEIRKQVNVPLMLDESLTSMHDAEHAIRHQTCDLLNIRLSKCGGFLNSLRLAACAKGARLGYQLGCHPGESGILSAAGRHWATSVGDIRYLEGSYDRHLLEELPTNEDITFGYGGRAPELTGPGLGVTVNLDVLKRVTVRKQSFPV